MHFQILVETGNFEMKILTKKDCYRGVYEA